MTTLTSPRARSLRVAGLLAATLLLTGCSSSLDASTSAPTTEGSPTPTAPEHDLRFVSQSAPACGITWVPGATLPENYEWCSDEAGDPVAGVRIGSCEVVTHAGEMYAVPGGRITAALGPLARDPQFTTMLTGCKRRPA